MCRQQENLTAENAVLHKLAEKQRSAKEAQDELHRSLGDQLVSKGAACYDTLTLVGA
jgi:hypothetical protein